MSITAINKKHQKAVNQAYKALRKYHKLVNQDSDLEPQSASMERLELKQSDEFNKYLEVFECLPKREQDNFKKEHKKIHGYT